MTDITIERDGYKSFFKMGNEKIEIADYQIKSSADGTARLVRKNRQSQRKITQ